MKLTITTSREDLTENNTAIILEEVASYIRDHEIEDYKLMDDSYRLETSFGAVFLEIEIGED